MAKYLKYICLSNLVEDSDGLCYDTFDRDWEDFREDAEEFPVVATGRVNRWNGSFEIEPLYANSVADVVKRLFRGNSDLYFELGWDRRNGRLQLVWDHHDASGSRLVINHPDGKAVTESDLYGLKGGK